MPLERVSKSPGRLSRGARSRHTPLARRPVSVYTRRMKNDIKTVYLDSLGRQHETKADAEKANLLIAAAWNAFLAECERMSDEDTAAANARWDLEV